MSSRDTSPEPFAIVHLAATPGRYPVRAGEPLTVGAPCARGQVPPGAELVGLSADGSRIQIQSTPLDRWSDGSVRWMLLDFQADIPAAFPLHIAIEETRRSGRPLAQDIGGGRVLVQTGRADFALGSGGFPFESAASSLGKTLLDPLATRLTVEAASGSACVPSLGAAVIERNGPLHAVVRLEGHVRLDSGDQIDLVARCHFFARMPCVQVDLALRNPRRARHRGGFWQLGDAGSVCFGDVALHLSLPSGDAAPDLRCSEEHGRPLRLCDLPLRLHQESSGGDHWDSPVHRDSDGRVPLGFRGYRLTTPTETCEGRRATPVVTLQNQDSFLALSMERFWENFPKAISADRHSLTLHLFPAGDAQRHELQGGEQKTHTFWLGLEPDGVADVPLDWCRAPTRAVPDPASVAASGAISWMTPRSGDPHTPYLAMVDEALEGAGSFTAKRERVDEYGWRHFGDVWADHEAVAHQGRGIFVSHYNNQYDVVGGCAIQLLRSGDARWWSFMDDMARHVADIDIYHTDGDWSKYNHGLFWHTVHHRDAGLSTHRSYPKTEGVAGGGPSASHLYTTGLLLHHLLTGSEQSREAVLELAQFVIDADDGTRSVFRWIDSGPTGLVSASAEPGYHGPGRAPGNALNALVDAHRLTLDSRFLDKAEEIVRRCVHPDDDIERLGFRDVERRWSYTVFLQALGKLLSHLQELGNTGPLYAYARASLLAYARWMADREYPYLDKPELLEFPTETWAAQELRKCEVFNWATLHADATERDRFVERSRFFFDAALRMLSGMPTRTMTRPLALLLSYGWSQAALASLASLPETVTPAPYEFGSPQAFEPQKSRAIRRASIAAGAVGGMLLGALAILLHGKG